MVVAELLHLPEEGVVCLRERAVAHLLAVLGRRFPAVRLEQLLKDRLANVPLVLQSKININTSVTKIRINTYPIIVYKFFVQAVFVLARHYDFHSWLLNTIAKLKMCF